ncbi:MAG TPA: cyclodeaminase/cyclohydrolase family protein [Acidobacteriaceae bacterium]|nr:cyclodeaminase/cyclohydrolase family protein [Acidobacteriaceae bacterium]
MTENHDGSLWENSLLEFRNRVAAGSATPGGGAVAAVTASFAAALLQMVCAISSTRKSGVGMKAIAAKVKICEEKLARYAEEDIRAFDRYMAARKTRSASADADAQRSLVVCTEVPLAAAEVTAKLEAYAAEIALNSPDFLSSDLATARHLLDASRKALLANVTINLVDLEDGEAKRALVRRLETLQSDTPLVG